MNSLDFLSPREVIEDCIRLAAIPSLAVVIVGCVAWGVLAGFGRSGSEEPAFALVWPFIFSAIYGNIVIYNTRWKHGVKVLRGHWWYRLTGLAIAWSVIFVALGMGVEFALATLGILARQRTLIDAAEFILAAAGFALLLSLLPAKDQYVT